MSYERVKVGDYVRVRTNESTKEIYNYEGDYADFPDSNKFLVIGMSGDTKPRFCVVTAGEYSPRNILGGYVIKKYGIDSQFLGKYMWWIWPTAFLGIETAGPSVTHAKSNGLACKLCREFYPYAESNQPDGTLACYSCRSTRSWQL